MSPPGSRRALLSLVGLALAGALCLLWALAAGEIAVPLGDVFDALAGGGDGMQVAIIRELRLPRAIAAFACGGLLALAGALMQVLLRNPLADPYVLGISGGAAVGGAGGDDPSAWCRGWWMARPSSGRCRRWRWCSACRAAMGRGPRPVCCSPG